VNICDLDVHWETVLQSIWQVFGDTIHGSHHLEAICGANCFTRRERQRRKPWVIQESEHEALAIFRCTVNLVDNETSTLTPC